MTLTAETGDPRPLRESLEFVRGLIANPRKVASLSPSSRPLARRIAAQVDPTRGGIVLEFGPGTGAITTALLEHGIDRSRLLLLEADPHFAKFLHGRFPDVRISCRNALEFEQELQDQPLAAIVSGLPLLNLDECTRAAFVDRCMKALGPEAPLVQLSFGWKPPVGRSPRWNIKSAGVELLNFPPATVWVYSRDRASPASEPLILQCPATPSVCKICGAPSVESGEGHDDVQDPLCLHHLEAMDPSAAELPKEVARRNL